MIEQNSTAQYLTLSDNTVIEFLTADHELGARSTTLVDLGDIYQVISTKFSQNEDPEYNLDWFKQGVQCKFIKHRNSSKGKIDGKIRLKLAFIPNPHSWEKINARNQDSSEWIEACDEDVIIISPELLSLPSGHIFHLKKTIFSKQSLIKSLRQYLSLDNMAWYRYAWLDYGVPCKVLLSEIGVDGWVNGRISLRIELQSNLRENQNETKSSLDDIRNAIEAN